MEDMNDINQRWGASFNLRIELDDDAETVDMYIRRDGISQVLGTAPFVDGVAVIAVTAEDMELELGAYEYTLSVHYAGGGVDKYPEANCEECELPKLIICDTADNDDGSSS